jgi:hypothetical protein
LKKLEERKEIKNSRGNEGKKDIKYFIVYGFYAALYTDWVYAVAYWLRHCATNRQVAGLIPDGVIGIFH